MVEHTLLYIGKNAAQSVFYWAAFNDRRFEYVTTWLARSPHGGAADTGGTRALPILQARIAYKRSKSPSRRKPPQ